MPGAAPDLADQIVEVLHDGGTAARPDWSVGSGFVVGGRRVLTAAHNVAASGELVVRFRGVEEHPATLAALPDGAAALDPELDLAVLEITTPVAERPRMRFARIDAHPQLATPNIEGCWAIGFPRFQEKERARRDRPLRESARVDGYVPMGEGLVEGRPTLAATRAPRELPAGAIGESEWQGMSGAVVFAGPLAIGVITEHHRPAGGGSLTIAPVALLDERPDARDWWALLGVDAPDALLTLPVAVPGPLGEPWSFEAFLASRRRHFTGREWLLAEISAWVADGAGSARLLTGPPGSGKSAVFAEIAAGGCGPVLAHHCCIADTPATLDPARFVRSVAAIAAASLPELADRLHADERLASRLSEAAVAADPASAFESGLLEPLRSLPAPLEPQLLVVDALDEALVTTGPVTIADLLGPRLGQFPPWLRFLATSRPLPEVRARLGSPPELALDAHPAENAQDLRRLVTRRLAQDRLAERLAQDGRPAATVATDVVDAAAGSFLVATMALDAVELDQLTFREIAELPPGLGAAYAAFFGRLYPDPAAYAPARTVLEAIVAAQELLTRPQLGAITGLDDEIELPPILQRLAAFVPAREGRYAAFHRSLVEWLSEFDPQTDLPRAGPFAVSLRRGHDRLADWCLKGSAPAYRIRHLITHLAGARRYDELAAAATDWRRVSAVVEGAAGAGTTSFRLVEDLRAALAALPADHARRQVVDRLAAAARADAHFLARHPGLWFQCCWNRGWWSDAPAAAGAFADAAQAPEDGAEMLSPLVESWRGERPGDPWLRARWPYPDIGLPILARIADVDRSTYAVGLAPDGATLCSGDESGVRTWDPLTGAPLAAYATPGDYITDVVFTSPEEVVAGTGEGSIMALRVANLGLARAGQPLGGKRVHVAALGGARVAATTADGTLGIWDVEHGDWLERAEPGGRPSALAASPDGGELIVGTDEWTGPSVIERLRVGDLAGGATWQQQTPSSVHGVGWSADGRTVAWTEYDPGVLVIRTEGSAEQRVALPGESNGGPLTFADGGRAIACSADNAFGIARLVVVDVATGRIRTSVPSHRGAAYSLAVDPDSRWLASAGNEETLVWDFGQLLRGVQRVTRDLAPDAARFLPDGRLVLAATELEVIRVVDLDAIAVETELPGHEGGVAGMAVAGDGRVACATGAGPVLLWDPRGWTATEVARHADGASAVAFSRDGRLLATGGGDGAVRVVDLDAQTEVSLTIGDDVTGLALAPDGRHVAVATFSDIVVWSLEDRKAVTPPAAATTYGLAFTPDGGQVAYVAPGAVVLAIDARTGAAVVPEPAHEAAHLAELGCRDPRWSWRSPRGGEQRLTTSLEMPLVELATGREVAWFPLVWAESVPDPTGRTWALLTKQQLYVLTLEDA